LTTSWKTLDSVAMIDFKDYQKMEQPWNSSLGAVDHRWVESALAGKGADQGRISS